MRARAVVVVVVAAAGAVRAEPRPQPVDIKPYRDKLIVLQDGAGGIYVVSPDKDEPHAFYGAGKTLYEQRVVTYSADGSVGRWDVGLFAPRVPRHQPGSISRMEDGTYRRYCGGEDVAGLTQLTGDKARQVLDRSAFVTPGVIHTPHLLARDDSGVYYYVDQLSERYGGNGFRVFVGRKGGMKELPLTDVTRDSGGEVYSTKAGDLRFVATSDDGKHTATWIRGDKRTTLVFLEPDDNWPLIFKDLGIYTFIGTICENM